MFNQCINNLIYILCFPKGYYVESSRPETVTMPTEEMADFMTKELLEGCDGTDMKAGVIGEVGCSWPLAGLYKSDS